MNFFHIAVKLTYLECGMKIFNMMVILFLVGCSTNRRLDADGLADKKGIFFGKVDIMFNGKQFTENCSLVFEQEDGESEYALDESGYITVKAPMGKISFKRVICMDDAPYVHLFTGAHFHNYGKMTKTYFGNITITWLADEEKKVSVFQSFFGGGKSVNKDKSDGMAKMTVKKNIEPVLREFNRMNSSLTNLGTRTVLMKVGKSK